MKQTNNAIKFLLAQYRAIFKQAYLKGLVSAVVLTSGLAAGATANAAGALNADGFKDLSADTTIQTSGTYDDLDIGVSGTVDNIAEQPFTITIDSFTGSKKQIAASGSGSNVLNAQNVNWNIASNAAGITIQDIASGSLEVNTGNITVGNGTGAATLDVKAISTGLGTTVNVDALTIGDGTTKGTVTITGGDAKSVAKLAANTITLGTVTDSKITLAGEAASAAVLSGQISADSVGTIDLTSTKFGTLNIWTAENESTNINLDLGSGTAVIDTNGQTLALGATGKIDLKTLTLTAGSTLDISAVTKTNATAVDTNEITIEDQANLKVGADALNNILSGAGTAGKVTLNNGTITLNAGSDLVKLASGSIEGTGTVTADSLVISDAVATTFGQNVILTTPKLTISSGDFGTAAPVVTETLITTTSDAINGSLNLAYEGASNGLISGTGSVVIDENSKVDISGAWQANAGITVSGSSSQASLALDSGDAIEMNGKVLTVNDDGQVNVGSGAALSFTGTGASLTIKGTSKTNASVTVNSGTVTFGEGSALSVTSGNFTVKNSDVDLTTAGTVTTGTDGSIVADQGANITIDNDLIKTNKTVIKVQNGGTLSATNLTIASGSFATTAIDLTADGTLKVDNLTVTDELKSSSLAGTILVNKTLQGAAKDASVVVSSGTLQLGADDAAKGSIKNDLTVANTTNVFGTWTGKGLTVSGSGKLNVGSVNDKDGTVVDGNLTADTIKIADSGKITVNQDSVLLVKGDSGETATAEELIGKDGYYGFSLTDKTVNVNGGTFTIGANAVAGLQDAEVEEDVNTSGSSTDFNYIRDNFGTYDLTGNGTLKIEFAEGDNLTKEEYLQLKKELLAPVVGDDGILTSGKLDIGGAEIEGLTTGEGSVIQNGSISFDTYQQFKDELAGLDTNEITSAKLTDANGTVESLNIGSIQLAKGGSISFTGDNSLNTASNGNLIADVNGKAADGTVESGASLSLNGNGAVNDIVLQEGEAEDYTTLNINASNKLNSIAAEDTTYTKVVVGASGEATVAKDITVAELENNNKLTVTSGDVTTNKFTNNGTASLASGSLTTNELTNNGALSVKTDVTTVKFADTAESTLSANKVTITAADADSISTVAGTVTATESFTLNGFDIENRAKVAGKIIADKGTVNLKNADVAESGIVSAKNANLSGDIAVDGEFVVSDKTTIADAALVNLLHDASLGDVVLTASTIDRPDNDVPGFSVENGALVVAKTITGATGNEIAVGVDEGFEGKSATGYLEVSDQLDLSGAKLVTEPNYQEKAALVAVNRLSGKKDNETLGLLNGDVFVGQNSAVGFGVTLAELQSKMSQFLVDGAFQDPSTNDGSSYGAVMYLDKPLSISSKYGIVLTADSYEEATVDTTPGSIYFGENTALAVNTDNAKTGEAYIKFVTESSTSEKQSLAAASVEPRKTTTTNSGTLIAAGGDIVLFGDTYRKSYQLFDSNIAIKGDDEAESGEITVISANGFLVGTLNNDSNGAVSLGINEEKAGVFLANASSPVQSSLIAYIRGYNGEAEKITNEGETGAGANTKAAADTPTTIIPGVADENLLFTYDKNGKKIYDYNNYFLSQVVLGGNAADAEKVARLGVYGGTAQAALTAGATTYEAVAGRMGVGAQNGNITFADNGQGAGLWVTPVYKNHDSDGFGAQGLTYGADLDLYGVALGADYTLENGLRVGAAFNVGSGDADGQGAGAGVSNDFDYYGFTVYGGFTMDQLSVVADVSYTAVDNDVEANTGVEKVSASMDSTNLSFGVTAQYAFNMNGVSVTPHAGLRYTNIDLDDYTVRGSADIAKYSADSASVFSIPVGVTFAKEITSGAWTIKPALDLTLTANMGDDSVDGSVTWAGVENLKTNLESEIIDSFTYGAALGVSAKSGNMSFGFGVNYTGASSADEYGVSANARFVF